MSLSALYTVCPHMKASVVMPISSVHVRVQCGLVPRPRMSEKFDLHGLGKRLMREHGM